MLRVSIITVCFNSGLTLKQTLESIIAQTYPNIELILIDGGSTDNTLDIIKKFQNNITYFSSEKDSGIYDAMNRGISMASGEIIGILNSDDFYCRNNIIEMALEAFLSNPEIDGVYSDLNYVDQFNVENIIRIWKSNPYDVNSFYWGWMPPHPTVFLRKQVYKDVGNFNLQFRSAADYEFLLRACLKFGKKLQYMPGVSVHMRTGGASNASMIKRLKANSEDRLAWKINGLKGGFLASLLKPIRKIPQFWKKK